MQIIVETSAKDTTIMVATHEHGPLVICSITAATPKEATEKFIDLCTVNSSALSRACAGWQEGINRNHNLTVAGQKGKEQPEFKIKERLVAKLLKEAGVVDS